jgi:hypothetical protein
VYQDSRAKQQAEIGMDVPGLIRAAAERGEKSRRAMAHDMAK